MGVGLGFGADVVRCESWGDLGLLREDRSGEVVLMGAGGRKGFISSSRSCTESCFPLTTLRRKASSSRWVMPVAAIAAVGGGEWTCKSLRWIYSSERKRAEE